MTEKDITIKGKTTYSIWPRWWWVTCRRARLISGAQDDAGQHHRPAAEQNALVVYTEIIDVKQCYPNTALVGVRWTRSSSAASR